MPAKRRREEEKDDDDGGTSTSGSEDDDEEGSEDGSSSSSSDDGDGMKHGFDKDTGALSRPFKSYAPPGKSRGWGKTAAHDDHPFLRPQIIMIIGPTGSGKTTCALNILEEILENVNEKKLGEVMFYTGSPHDDLIQRLDPEDVAIFGPEHTHTFITKLRQLQGLISLEKKERDRPLNVIILDDIANNPDLSPNNAKGSDIGDILVQHRHIPVLVILLLQKWAMGSTFARQNLSHLFLFPGKSDAEVKGIMRELPLPADPLMKAVKLLQGQDHQFLWVDLLNRTGKLGFERVILE